MEYHRRNRLLNPTPFAALAILLAPLATAAAQSPDDESWLAATDAPPTWRVRGEYLYWWSNGNAVPPLVTTSPAGTPITQAGVLGTGGTQTLFGGRNIDTGPRSGGRITMSRWLEDDDDTVVEFVGLYLADDYQSGNFSAQSTGSPILARPFRNAVSGLEDSELVAFPGQLAGQVSVTSYSEAYSAAGLLRQNFSRDAGSRFDLLGGYRYFRYREALSIRENLTSTNPGGLIPLGTTTDLVDSFAVGSDFHGVEFGGVGEWFWQTVSVELLAKVALGGVFRHSVVSGNTVATIPGLPSFSTPGGLLALPSNIGSRSSSGFGVLPELNLNTKILLAPRVTLLAGYTLIVLNDVLRTGDQIDRTVNTSQIAGQPLQGPARPAPGLHQSTLVLQGLNFGLEYRW